MKKILISSLFVFSLFILAQSASAATCGDPALNHAAYDVFNGVSTTTVPAIDNRDCGNGNPLNVMQVWGLDGAHTVTVPPGTPITDDAGNTYMCSLRVDSQGCSVLVHLPYYTNAMRATWQALVVSGLASQFPQFAYWGK